MFRVDITSVRATDEELQSRITALQTTLAFMPEGDSERMYCLGELTDALLEQAERTGDSAVLNEGIEVARASVKSAPLNHPRRSNRLSNLGGALAIRFGRTKSFDDLNEAIEVSTEAVISVADNYPELPSFLNSLAAVLFQRAERTDSNDDVIEAFELWRKSVTLAPEYASAWMSSGQCHMERYVRTGALEHLNLSIEALQKAVNFLPTNHRKRGGALGSLGGAFVAKFGLTRSSEDIDRGVEMLEKAVGWTSPTYPDRWLLLNNLGLALSKKLLVEPKEHLHIARNVLNSSIRYFEEAITLLPENDTRQAGLRSNLGRILCARFAATMSVCDLDSAVEHISKAVDSIPPNDPDRAMYLSNLGDALWTHFQETGLMDSLDASIQQYEDAFAIVQAPSITRIEAVISAKRVLSFRNSPHDRQRLLHLLEDGIKLLPSITPRILKQGDQQRILSKFAGFTAEAVSILLDHGKDPYAALQLLELGRGVIASLTLQVRSDVSDLKLAHSDIAVQWERIRDELDRPPSTGIIASSLPGSLSDIERRTHLSHQFDRLLDTIRQQKGFERFLLGPTESELRLLAGSGPIVVFNVSEIRSDALLVESHRIHTIQLPLLTHTDLKNRAQNWFSNQGRESMERDVVRRYHSRGSGMDILEWLWKVAVSPVLTELGITTASRDDGSRPRVWWVTSGLLSRLPIHASGNHAECSTENALDRVISSYIPSIKSLRYARDRIQNTSNDHFQTALFLSMTETPGQASLPGAGAEVTRLSTLVPNAVTPIVLHGAAQQVLIDILPDVHLCHFACHGVSDPLDPSNSQLLIQDWETHPLSVKDIAQLRLQDSQFAYLSACSAADCKVETLLDESINLATAFQLAGFPSVVGTLWPIHDHYSVEVAEEVYVGMINGERLDVRRSAAALNLAVRHLRDKLGGGSISVWAPFIHIGV